MPEPERIYDDEQPEEPIDKPGWVYNGHPTGGGKSTPSKKGHLKSVPTGEEVNDQEDAEADAQPDGAESAELNSLGQKTSEENPGWFQGVRRPGWRPFGTSRNPFTSSSRIRRGLLIASPLGIGLIVLVMMISIFLGSLKHVHFATILSSSGFASFQLTMRRFFADVQFDKSVFTEDSTGKVKGRPESNLLRRLVTGNDARTVADQLGRDGSIEYIRENGDIKGFQFGGPNGERVVYDDLSQGLFGKPADKLTIREEMTLKNKVVDEVQLRLAERLGEEGRFFRNDFWTGFREFTGIRMNTPIKFIRELVGKKPAEALAETRLEGEQYTTEGTKASSTNDTLRDTQNAEGEEVTKSIKLGERLRNPELFNRALTAAGIDPAGFASMVDKATPYVLAGTLYCIGRDLRQIGPAINKGLEENAARFAHQQQTDREQIQDGKTVNAEFVSAKNAEWDGTKDASGKVVNSPAEVSPFYAAYTNQSMANADMESLKNAPAIHIDTPLDWLGYVDDVIKNAISGGLVNVPGLGDLINQGFDAVVNKLCSLVMRPEAQTAFVIFDVVAAASTDGLAGIAETMLKAAVFFGGGQMIGKMLEDYVHSLAGQGCSDAQTGADRFTSSAVCTDYLNSQSSRGVAMGRPLSDDEAAASKTTALIENRQLYQQQPWQDRYFAIDNPYSLVGSLSVQVPTSLGSLFSSMISAIGSFPRTVASFFSGQMSGGLALGLLGGNHQQMAYAASGLDFQKQAKFFGVQQWGWSPEEINRVETDESFDLANNAAYVEQKIQADPQWDKDLSECYAPNKLLYEVAADNKCSADRLKQDDALHWRLYKAQSYIVDDVNQDVSIDNGN